MLFTLKKERKIAEATHNILAWRFGPYQDYDDDGEKAAGSRLLHLLELLNLNNVVVVVSRWYVYFTQLLFLGIHIFHL